MSIVIGATIIEHVFIPSSKNHSSPNYVPKRKAWLLLWDVPTRNMSLLIWHGGTSIYPLGLFRMSYIDSRFPFWDTVNVMYQISKVNIENKVYIDYAKIYVLLKCTKVKVGLSICDPDNVITQEKKKGYIYQLTQSEIPMDNNYM